MTESNPVQVTLSDDGLKIINAQNTADNATKGVTDLNDPNMMSVIEKQAQAVQYAGLTSRYNVILARAKDASISTTDLTTAYTNLDTFMSAILTDTTKASDVNRDTYKSLTDAYNTALSSIQNALNNSFNTDIDNMQSSVAVASQAASSAAIVASQATSTGNNASQVASQAASAASKASSDYTTLSTGIQDGSVVHITTKTVIDSAVIGTAEIANAAITDAKIGNISANHLTAGTIDFNTITGENINASNITTGTISTDRLNVGKLSALSADLGTVTAGNINGLDIVAKTFSTPNGTFTVDSSGNITATSVYLVGNKNFVYNSELLSNGAGWSFGASGSVDADNSHDGTSSVISGTTTLGSGWHVIARSKLMPLKNSAGSSYYSLSGWIAIWSHLQTTTARITMTLAFYNSAKTQIGSVDGNVDLSKTGDWQQVTCSTQAPAGSKYVNVNYQINGDGAWIAWSQPMISNSSRWQGYTADTGNVLSGGQVILDTDGTLTTTYTGITQDSDSYYSAWNLTGGTLSIGQGYITSTATGNRVVSNVPQSAATVKGTLTAAYLKFTEPDIPARTYLDATHFTVSSNNTSDIVTIDKTGVSLQNDAALNGPVFDWSGDGVQSQNLIMGRSPHTINTTDKHEIAFEIGRGDTGDYANIHVWSVVTASQLSRKKEVVPYNDSGDVVANTSLATYRYNQDDNTDITHVGPIIDDTNTNKKWFISPEIISTSGELGGAEIDLPASIFYGWSAIKALQRENENLQIRLRKLEIEGA
ncbi:autotransporter outer membrane beta-barrel domain-containing protein [Lactiplantibacillus carotarum]|uniref:phage tail protein n=1 Tax=Lactiplantibacillus carotarum TaxID=2993456 RepID=UPI00298EF3FA|nr:phage tail protein [Lactiplantibacillus carotarum]